MFARACVEGETGRCQVPDTGNTMGFKLNWDRGISSWIHHGMVYHTPGLRGGVGLGNEDFG